jgi:hypothetical protein
VSPCFPQTGEGSSLTVHGTSGFRELAQGVASLYSVSMSPVGRGGICNQLLLQVSMSIPCRNVWQVPNSDSGLAPFHEV